MTNWTKDYDDLADGAVRMLSRMRTEVQSLAKGLDDLQHQREHFADKSEAANKERDRLAEALIQIAGKCENYHQSRCWKQGRPQGQNGSAYVDRWCFPCMATAALNPEAVDCVETSGEKLVEVVQALPGKFSVDDPATWQIGQAVRYRRGAAVPWIPGVYLGVGEEGSHQISDMQGNIRLFDQTLVPLVRAHGDPPAKVRLL